MLEHKTLQQLLAEAKVDHVLAFSRKGEPRTIHDAVSGLESKQRPAMIVGGFPHGNFSEATKKVVDEIVCVDAEMLEAWTITSRAIYEYERVTSLPAKKIMKSDWNEYSNQ